jgi:hypothetical protein
VYGNWSKTFYRSAGATGAFAFPQVGDSGISTPTSVDWASSYWITPPLVTAEVRGDPLGPNDRLDTAKPNTQGGDTSSLSWAANRFVRPVARWTNLKDERRSQNLVVVFSVLVGVGASLVASALEDAIETVAKQQRQIRTATRRGLRRLRLRRR